ncbi:MAG TPA: MarR family transcriptional regulator [Thermoanaerobaculia bacterium]|nr:MarR family transcriptional regulator [Thermoanaerobaculia bacterium]
MTRESGIQRELKQTRPFPSKSQEAAVALLRTADLIRRHVSSVVEERDLTVQQYNVLRILRGAGEKGLPTLEIAERMIEQTPGITRLIDRLEAKQLVTRERCATDRRQVFCRIAAAGLELLATLDTPLRRAEEEALSSIGKRELAQLLELLERARDGIRTSLETRRQR